VFNKDVKVLLQEAELVGTSSSNTNDRAFNFESICVCVVSVGYLAHNPRIVTRMVELRVIIIVFLDLMT
jgi:hypothetical protein